MYGKVSSSNTSYHYLKKQLRIKPLTSISLKIVTKQIVRLLTQSLSDINMYFDDLSVTNMGIKEIKGK